MNKEGKTHGPSQSKVTVVICEMESECQNAICV